MLQAIKDAIAIIQAVRTMLPEIIALLGDIETAFPGYSIDRRIEMLKTVLTNTLNLTDSLSSDVDKLWAVIKAVIAQHVQDVPGVATT